jgi:transposase
MILSIAYYSISEQNSASYLFEKWGYLHKHPYGKDISSQKSSELFASITEDAKLKFFKLQGKRRIEKEFWTYDITSISSYSRFLKQVLYGHNKENDRLKQTNLAFVFGEESELPFYYRNLAGNTPDSKTVPNLLADLSMLGFDKLKLVKDRGFYAEANINELYRRNAKFLIGAKSSTLFIRNEIDKVRDKIDSFENYSLDHKCFGYASTTKWNYTNENGTIKEKKQMYAYVYYNKERAVAAEEKLTIKLAKLYNELKSGNKVEKNKKLYEKYFIVKGKQIITKKDVINEQIKYYGYFVNVSNIKMDVWDARHQYLRKDVVEKAFHNFKDRLGGRRNLVSSEQSLDGKLFVLFVALIIVSYINKQMNKNNIYAEYTMQQLFDKLDIIECFENQGKKKRIGEVNEKQKKIYIDLGVKSIS